MAIGRPHFELSVTGGPKLKHNLTIPVLQFQARDDLRMTAVEALGNPQD